MNGKMSINGVGKTTTEQIIGIILSRKAAEKIILFGSRAEDDFKEASDIDIAILGKNWTDRDTSIVKFNLDEDIKTPLKFDVLNFYAISKDSLKEDILKKGKIIYERGKN